jgi:hypothetical protein
MEKQINLNVPADLVVSECISESILCIPLVKILVGQNRTYLFAQNLFFAYLTMIPHILSMHHWEYAHIGPRISRKSAICVSS